MTTRCYALRDDQGQRVGQLSPQGGNRLRDYQG